MSEQAMVELVQGALGARWIEGRGGRRRSVQSARPERWHVRGRPRWPRRRLRAPAKMQIGVYATTVYGFAA
jgi:hypothetical protein